MIDDILELFRKSGLLKTDGEFNALGEHMGDAFFAVCSENAMPSAMQIAEILAQFITLPTPAEAAGTVGYNINFNIDPMHFIPLSDHDVKLFAGQTKLFLSTLAEDSVNE